MRFFSHLDRTVCNPKDVTFTWRLMSMRAHRLWLHARRGSMESIYKFSVPSVVRLCVCRKVFMFNLTGSERLKKEHPSTLQAQWMDRWMDKRMVGRKDGLCCALLASFSINKVLLQMTSDNHRLSVFLAGWLYVCLSSCLSVRSFRETYSVCTFQWKLLNMHFEVHFVVNICGWITHK